jgi:hypothetical protein
VSAEDPAYRVSSIRLRGKWIGWHGRHHQQPVVVDTKSGIRVTVDGDSITAEYATDPSEPDGGRAEREQELSDLFLVETLETRSPASVDWTETSELLAGGRTITLHSPTVVVDWTPRRAVGDLADDERALQALDLEGKPAVRAALIQLRFAMQAWRGDASESVGRLYAAAETVVLGVVGDSRTGDWRRFGDRTGYGGDRAMQVYWSLQYGRHVRPDRAGQALVQLRLPRLNPGDLIDDVTEMIRAAAK